MPKSQRKARAAPPCSCFCNRLRQFLSCWLVVATSRVSASTHTLSQGISWQPFRGSGRDKKHLRVQQCQQKPSRSQDIVWQGSLLPLTWETSRSGGTWAAFGVTACVHSTNPPPSWKPETASLMANCLAYPSLPLRKRNGGFHLSIGQKPRWWHCWPLLKIRHPLRHALASADIKKTKCQPNTGGPLQVLIFPLIVGFTWSFHRLLNPWGLLKKRLKFQNCLLFLGNLPKLSYLTFQPYLAVK